MNTFGCRSAVTEEPISVLFVEEDFDRCADYVAAVVARGWRARVTLEPATALGMAESDRPDVVVTEADAGGTLDGFELARQLKSGVSTHHLPVIVLTDRPLHELVRSARAGLCSGIVARPCEAESVIIAIRSALMVADVLARRRAQRESGYGSLLGMAPRAPARPLMDLAK